MNVLPYLYYKLLRNFLHFSFINFTEFCMSLLIIKIAVEIECLLSRRTVLTLFFLIWIISILTSIFTFLCFHEAFNIIWNYSRFAVIVKAILIKTITYVKHIKAPVYLLHFCHPNFVNYFLQDILLYRYNTYSTVRCYILE